MSQNQAIQVPNLSSFFSKLYWEQSFYNTGFRILESRKEKLLIFEVPFWVG